MGFASLLAGRIPGESAFLLGTAGELEELFGAPLPALPNTEHGPDGRCHIAFESSPRLADCLSRWLGAAERSLAAGVVPLPGSADDDVEKEYLDLLTAICRNVLAADRRQGIYNLFWLAHSGEVARASQRYLSSPGRHPNLRFRIYPLISGLLRRADDGSRLGLPRPQRIMLDFRRGSDASDLLVRSILDDQIPIMDPEPGRFDPSCVLVSQNPRFRISAPAFEEITRILRKRLRAAVSKRGDRLRDQLRLAAGGREPEAAAPDSEWNRYVFADRVRECLLHDLAGAGAELLRSRVLSKEAGDDSWAELFTAYADLTRCLRRADAIAVMRRALEPATGSLEHPETRQRYLEGRIFRFTPDGGVQGGLRDAAMLFADIRGFTRAAEGPVSEGELARELYEIFDPAALVIRRFGGCVDKYLGDGFMATFTGASPVLSAVRSAVVLQQVLVRLRERGRTGFRMGISLHAGRVSVARFFRDGRHVDDTVIGRQVNIAGRLADSGELRDPAGAESAETAASRTLGGVTLEDTGRLRNEGIVASGALVESLGKSVALERFREGAVEGRRWYDRDLCLWLHLGYLGEARFRGVEATMPVYALVSASPASS